MPNPHVFEEFVQQGIFYAGDDGNDDGSGLGLSRTFLNALLPLLTGLIGFIVYFLVNYTLSDIVFSLAVVETRAVVDRERSQSVKAREKSNDTNRFTTSSIRRTLRHLHQQAGDLSMFRGLGCNIVIYLVTNVAVAAFRKFLLVLTAANEPGLAISWTASVAASLLLAQAATAWLHVVISKPSHLFWVRRLPRTLKSVVDLVWLPCIACLTAETFVDSIAVFLNRQTTSENASAIFSPSTVSAGTFYATYKLVVFALVSLVKPVFDAIFMVPLRATMIRVQASLLPEEDETILPMDRQFRGQVSSGILHQAQPLTARQAWQSIDRATHWRLTSLYAKIYVIEYMTFAFFWCIAVIEIGALEGWSLVWVLMKLFLDLPLGQQDLDSLSASARGIVGEIMRNATNVHNATTATTSTLHAASTAVEM